MERSETMADEDRQIRFAAETLLSASLESHRSSYTQHSVNRTPDTVFSEDFIAGARTNGNMSNVRRFFCLFVTFDFFFTCLMWLICTVISGQSLETAFKQQILYYNIETSLFDVVMAAFCRFVVLLLFYALLYIRHWIIIALSTTLSSGFLMTKVFMFDWSKSSQPGFQVLLIISSFVIAWGEVWFFVFRDIPLETRARDWLLGSTDNERAPLLQPNLIRSSQPNENIHDFYTPVESPDHSDEEEDAQRRGGRLGSPFIPSTVTKIPENNNSLKPKDTRSDASLIVYFCIRTKDKLVMLPSIVFVHCKMDLLRDFFFGSRIHDVETDAWSIQEAQLCNKESLILDYYKKADSLSKRAYELLTSSDWVLHKITSSGDEIHYMNLPKPDGKIFKITGVVDAPAQALRDILFEDVDGCVKWNKQLAESKKIHVIDDNTDVVYQATQKHGQIQARDFVVLRHRCDRDSYFISAGISILSKLAPARRHYIRGENGVSCWATEDISDGQGERCRFTWIMNTDLKGWLPQKVIEMSTSMLLVQFMSSLRGLVRSLPDSQKPN